MQQIYLEIAWFIALFINMLFGVVFLLVCIGTDRHNVRKSAELHKRNQQKIERDQVRDSV